MQMKNLLCLLFLLLGDTLASQSLAWEQTSFPNNNYVYFITILGNKIFVGSHEGLYLSADEGLSWQNLTGSSMQAVNSFIYRDGVYYIGSWVHGVHQSFDLAAWKSVGAGLPQTVTSIEFFDGQLYAGTPNSVYVLSTETGFWKQDSLKVKNIHNEYVLALKTHDGALYAAGCDYLYYKEAGQWAVVDTNYQYCGNKILDAGAQVFLSTTGGGIQKFDSPDTGVVGNIIADPQDSLSMSPADVAFFENELYVLCRSSIYYYNLDSSEIVCDDMLSSIAFGTGNVFVGTSAKGIWKKGLAGIPRAADLKNSSAKEIALEVWPTPSEGKLLATYQVQKEHPARLTLFDATGRTALVKDIVDSGSHEIYLATPGVYLAVLTNGDKKLVKKVIVQ